jgi:hypothetical protein
MDALNPSPCSSLDSVGSGFVHGLAAFDVIQDFLVANFSKVNVGGRRRGLNLSRWIDQADGRRDLVAASGEQAKHACGVFGIARLLENVIVRDDDGIRAQHKASWETFGDRFGLLAGQPARIIERGLAWPALLRDVRRMALECNLSFAQQFLPSRGTGCED